MPEIETDYLVVGADASGMAFTDALIASSDAEVVMVDRRHRPGGHWNDEPASGFTVIGAGKTSMDTCCWLIEQGVDPDTIRWIRPRDDGQQVGNFPQAFTHLALIDAAVRLDQRLDHPRGSSILRAGTADGG